MVKDTPARWGWSRSDMLPLWCLAANSEHTGSFDARCHSSHGSIQPSPFDLHFHLPAHRTRGVLDEHLPTSLVGSLLATHTQCAFVRIKFSNSSCLRLYIGTHRHSGRDIPGRPGFWGQGRCEQGGARRERDTTSISGAPSISTVIEVSSQFRCHEWFLDVFVFGDQIRR